MLHERFDVILFPLFSKDPGICLYYKKPVRMNCSHSYNFNKSYYIAYEAPLSIDQVKVLLLSGVNTV